MMTAAHHIGRALQPTGTSRGLDTLAAALPQVVRLPEPAIADVRDHQVV